MWYLNKRVTLQSPVQQWRIMPSRGWAVCVWQTAKLLIAISPSDIFLKVSSFTSPPPLPFSPLLPSRAFKIIHGFGFS